jgi:hypothetical protein
MTEDISPDVEVRALEKALSASREHARRARREGLDDDTCRFWSGVSGFLRSRIRALRAGEEPDWPDAANSARTDLSRPEIAIDTRPQCTAESEHPDSNHPSHGHLCGLEEGHPEREHRCPCGENWFVSGGSSAVSGVTPE